MPVPKAMEHERPRQIAADTSDSNLAASQSKICHSIGSTASEPQPYARCCNVPFVRVPAKQGIPAKPCTAGSTGRIRGSLVTEIPEALLGRHDAAKLVALGQGLLYAGGHAVYVVAPGVNVIQPL